MIVFKPEMRRVSYAGKGVVAGVALALSLIASGCITAAKPKPVAPAAPAPPTPVLPPAPAPPPEKLSIPQTRVELPAPQPLSAEALAATRPPEEPVNATPPPTTRPSRRNPNSTASTAPVRTETVGPTPPAAAAAPPPTPEPRPPIQEILPAAETKRLQDQAANDKRIIRQRLEVASKGRQSKQEQRQMEQIQLYLKQSDDAEQQGDMRKAYELAERAMVLAQRLPGGR